MNKIKAKKNFLTATLINSTLPPIKSSSLGRSLGVLPMTGSTLLWNMKIGYILINKIR
jgi:hypothetical protein